MPREMDGRAAPALPTDRPDWLQYQRPGRAKREIPYDDPQALADLVASGQLIFTNHNGEVGYAWDPDYVSPEQLKLNESRDRSRVAAAEREARSRQREQEAQDRQRREAEAQLSRNRMNPRVNGDGGERNPLWWMDQMRDQIPQIQAPQWTPYAPQGNAPQTDPRTMWQDMMSQWSGR